MLIPRWGGYFHLKGALFASVNSPLFPQKITILAWLKHCLNTRKIHSKTDNLIQVNFSCDKEVVIN